MIEYIRGRVVRLNPAAATVETASGVAYLLNITLPTYTTLESQPDALLWAHEVIRDDQHQLFGFIDENERELFRQLIGVSGVGPGTARLILSAIPATELPGVIAGNDLRRLKGVKGIGGKTAERIIVDLRDKIKVADTTLFNQSPANNEAFDEALAALVMLGFAAPQSKKVLTKLFDAEPGLKVETAIRKALPLM